MERWTLKRRFFTSIALTLTLTIFSPLCMSTKAKTNEPNILGKSALTMDLETGEIIYSKDPDSKRYPASISKLMTAILLAENKQKTDVISYTELAKKQPEYSFNLNIKPRSVGETMSATDSMKTLLLYSANDEAYAIAENVGGSVEGFQKMMNDKAKELGMSNSHFVTPNGLHDADHYTTAYDLAILAKAAYSTPWVKETMAMKKETVKTSAGTIAIIENRNKNLGVDGCIGGKTGYTEASGRSLVALYERDGKKIVGVVLKSVYDSKDSQVFNDMKSLIDWSYAAERTTFYKSGETLKTVSVPYKSFRFFGKEKTIEVPLTIKEDVAYYDNALNEAESKLDFKVEDINPWKLDGTKKVAEATLSQRSYEKTYDLYTTVKSSDLVKANMGSYIMLILGIIVVLALIIIITSKIKTSSRKKHRSRYRRQR